MPGKFHAQKSLEGYSPWGRKRVGHKSDQTTTVDDIDAVFPSPKLKSSWGNRQVKSNYCTSMISIKMREM